MSNRNKTRKPPVLRTPLKSPESDRNENDVQTQDPDTQGSLEDEEEENEVNEDEGIVVTDMEKIVQLIMGIKNDVGRLAERVDNEVEALTAGILNSQDESMELRKMVKEIGLENLQEEIRKEKPKRKVRILGSSPEEEDEYEVPRRDRGQGRSTRRDSGFQRLGSEVFTGRDNIMVIESDKHLSIKWKNKTIDRYLKFLEEIEKFQLMNNQKVNFLFPHLEDDQDLIAQQLAVEFPRKYYSRAAIHQVDVKDLTSVCQAMYCPNDTQHFLKLLHLSCSSYAVEQRSKFDNKVKWPQREIPEEI
jgi:hypothetical protein